MNRNNPKIHNLDSLLLEKERLALECKNSEKQLEVRFQHIRENAVGMVVDHVFIPAVKKVFNMQNLLNLFSIGQLANSLGNSGEGTKGTIKNLGGIFSKGGLLMAVKIGYSLAKKFFL